MSSSDCKVLYREAQQELRDAYTLLDGAEPAYVSVACAAITLAQARCDCLLRELKEVNATCLKHESAYTADAHSYPRLTSRFTVCRALIRIMQRLRK